MSSRVPVLDSTVLGERFEVLASPKPLQGYFIAPGRDISTDQEVMVRLIPLAELEKTGSVLSCQKYLDRAGRLNHKNIAKIMGYGRSNGVLFVVDDHVPGHRLSHLLQRRRESNRPFGLKESLYLVIHVCNALAYAADSTPHGFLTPSHIWLRPDGRAKVCGFGMAPLVRHLPKDNSFTPWDLACTEVDLERSRERDLYSLSRIFYALLRNDVSYDREFIEQVADDEQVTPGLVSLFQRCTDGGESALSGPVAFREALHQVVAEMFNSTSNDDEPRRDNPSVPPPMPSELLVDQVAKPAGVDLSKVRLTSHEEDLSVLRWMYRKDKKVYGPVTGQQIIQRLREGQITGYVELKDLEGEEWHPLSEIVTFKREFDTWAAGAAARDEAAEAARLKMASIQWRNRILVASVIALITFVGITQYRSLSFLLETDPVSLDFNRLSFKSLPDLDVPPKAAEDPKFADTMKRYQELLSERNSKSTARGSRGLSNQGSLISGSDSQAAVEEKITQRLYNSLSRHRGLLKCLQDSLASDEQRRTFNLKVTILPNGGLTEIQIPGGGPVLGCCVRIAIGNYKVKSVQGITVSATLPFTVQR